MHRSFARPGFSLFTSALFMLTMFAGCSTGEVTEQTATREQAARNTVRLRVVHIVDDDSSNRDIYISQWGSGCVLAPVADNADSILILTAFHVVDRVAQDSSRYCVLVEHFPFEEGMFTSASDLLCYDEKRDLALIRAPRRGFSEAGTLIASELPIADAVPAYAAVIDEKCSPAGFATDALAPPTLRSPAVFDKLVAAAEPGRTTEWMLDKGARPGMSGSPLLNDKGLLIGIYYWGTSQQAFAIHLSEIHAFLDDNRLASLYQTPVVFPASKPSKRRQSSVVFNKL